MRIGVVYKISNTVTGQFYIGSSVNFEVRKACHLHELRKGKHHSPILQNSWNKHGERNFIFEIVEEVEANQLIKREQYWINFLKPKYNCSPTAGSPLGTKHTLLSRKHMSEAHKRQKLTKEAIAKRSLKQSGINHPFFGKHRSEKDRQAVRRGLLRYYKTHSGVQLGKHHSVKTKEKLSQVNLIPILQFSKDGEFIREWAGALIAARELDLHRTGISACLRGKLKTSGGFIWKYANE